MNLKQMEQNKSIRIASLTLTFAAGFCDTVTFVSANELFSAHVTGNFIVFAYDIIKHFQGKTWVKLLAFPVFILGVISGGYIVRRFADKYVLLHIEGYLLLLTGVAAIIISLFEPLPGYALWHTYMPALLIVFSMGLQNAFGKLYTKETFGPTTMMTGNVSQAVLELGNLIKAGFNSPADLDGLKHHGLIIGGFMLGCLLGALASQRLGLASVIIPGGLFLLVFSGYNSPKRDKWFI
jgi:uncharacterized membrane protein YoaK (UPF0700 family)